MREVVLFILGAILIFVGIFAVVMYFTDQEQKKIEKFIEDCHSANGTVSGVGSMYSKTFICNPRTPKG